MIMIAGKDDHKKKTQHVFEIQTFFLPNFYKSPIDRCKFEQQTNYNKENFIVKTRPRELLKQFTKKIYFGQPEHALRKLSSHFKILVSKIMHHYL